MIICFFECQKQHWVDWYKRSYCFQWTYPILRAPWPSYMNDVCLWIYDFLNIKNNLELTDTNVHIVFNEPIPYWGLHGLAIWMRFVYDYILFWLSKTTLSWLIQKFIMFLNVKNNLELTDTKGHIAFNEPIPYWGLHGLAIRMMFVYDYMVFWISKTTLSWLIQKFILLSMNLSHIEVSMA